MKTLLPTSLAFMLVSTSAVAQSTVKEFMEAVTDERHPKREVHLAYFSGLMDQTINMGKHLKMWCFPQPTPSRVRLTQEFVADLGQLALEQGHEQTLAMQLDQALLNRCGQRYLCKR